MQRDSPDEPADWTRKAANKKRRGTDPAVVTGAVTGCNHIPMSNTFGSCASGSAAAPTMVATNVFRVRLLRRLPRICLAIHSQTFVSTPTALGGAQRSLAVSGDSATVRGGTGRPDAAAA